MDPVTSNAVGALTIAQYRQLYVEVEIDLLLEIYTITLRYTSPGGALGAAG